MKTKIIKTAENLKTVLSAQNTYFVVEADITFQGISYVLGSGSVIEFVGGSFHGTSGTSLNLNGSQVIADPYPIFINLDVTGFSNCRVFAEWFIDGNEGTPEVYINKALRCAKGCPVVLAKQVYILKGTIVFPSTSPSTLIAAGSLEIDEVDNDNDRTNDPVAIDVNVNNVTIDINRIKFPEKIVTKKDEQGKIYKESVPDKGTAVRISGQVIHASINLNTILYPERGIEISPGREGTYANVQYLDINFQSITACYGIYIDIFSNGDFNQNWFTRSSIRGGRLQGGYGLFVAEGKNSPVTFNQNHVSELRIANIGFEKLSETPISLRFASRLRFENIRMAEGMPVSLPWIYLRSVSWINFNIHGDLNAEKILTNGICQHIKIMGSFLRDTRWGKSPFDTLVVNAVWTNNPGMNYLLPCMALTSYVKPFQMTNVVTRTGNLQEIQPTIIPTIVDKFTGLKALPRVLQFNISSATTINLDGLRDYAPVIYYFSVEAGASLTLISSKDGFIDSLIPSGLLVLVNNKTLKVKSGNYKMNWAVEGGKMKIQVNPV